MNHVFFASTTRYFIETSLEILICSILNIEDPTLESWGDYFCYILSYTFLILIVLGSILLCLVIYFIKIKNKDKLALHFGQVTADIKLEHFI